MFDEFWSIYPRKIAKAVARKAWARLSAEQQLMAAKAINTHCQYWKAKETELEFIPILLLGLTKSVGKMN